MRAAAQHGNARGAVHRGDATDARGSAGGEPVLDVVAEAAMVHDVVELDGRVVAAGRHEIVDHRRVVERAPANDTAGSTGTAPPRAPRLAARRSAPASRGTTAGRAARPGRAPLATGYRSAPDRAPPVRRGRRALVAPAAFSACFFLFDALERQPLQLVGADRSMCAWRSSRSNASPPQAYCSVARDSSVRDGLSKRANASLLHRAACRSAACSMHRPPPAAVDAASEQQARRRRTPAARGRSTPRERH